MNKMLTNYCYSWYRTTRRTNVLTRTDVSIAELTSEPIGEPTGEQVNARWRQPEEASERPMATARGSADRIV